MKKEVGLWVDHRKAVIVTMQDEVEVIRELNSNVEKHVRFSGDSPSKKVKTTAASGAEDVRDRQFADHLDGYYDGIISLISGADSIWVFGPGEAKTELSNRLKKAGLEARLVPPESVDKMSDSQIAAKVRDHYLR